MDDVFSSRDVRAKTDILTRDVVYKIAQAYGVWLPQQGAVVIGHDMRPESEDYKNAVRDALTSVGRDVIDIGLISTDMMFHAVARFDSAGGIMITASHNPVGYNGMKFSRENAQVVSLSGGLADVRDMAKAGDIQLADTPGTVSTKDILEEWAEYALNQVDTSAFEGLRLGVDAGNGMMGHVAPAFLNRLELDADERLYFELDGTFPNHEANPIKTETLEDLSKLVVEKKLDIGLAFDGDGDRFCFVDELGHPVAGGMVFLALTLSVLEKHPNSDVIHELRMSWSALDAIVDAGGKLHLTKVGNTDVKEAMVAHNAFVGGETSGHYMLGDNYNIDSAILAALYVIEYLRKHKLTFSEFTKKYEEYVQIEETNFEVEDKQAIIDKVVEDYTHKADTLDGVTVAFDDGWFNIRASVTEPLLRLNAEAKTLKRLEEIVETAKSYITR